MNRSHTLGRLVTTSHLLPALACLLIGHLVAASASAQVTNWTGATNDLWTESTNWTNGVPSSGDIANILGTFGSEFDVDLNGTQDISGITLNTTFTNFSNGTLDQNKSVAATFTASDTTLAGDAQFTDPGSVDWTRVTRPNGNFDATWHPGNGTQIQLTEVTSDTGGTYQIHNMNNIPAGAGYDMTADNSNIFQYNYVNNPNTPNTGSLTLQNGTQWESSTGFSAGTGSGVFTLDIDNSTLRITANSPVLGPNAKVVADNGTIEMPINGAKTFNLQMTNPADFDGTGLTISMRGISGATGTFEVASEDVGPFLDGFVVNDGNFSFAELVLENKFRRIFLQDSFDNAPGAGAEAIYVDVLNASFNIQDQTTTTEGLDLRGFNIYYQSLVGNLANWRVFDSVGGGSITQVSEFMPEPFVPEPSSALLLGLGAMVLSRHTRRRRRRS